MGESSAFDEVVNGIKGVAGIVGEVNTLIKEGGDIEGQIRQLSELTREILANGLTMVQLESSLRDKARMLEEKLREKENWEEEKKRYELRNTGAHYAFAYVLKESSQTPDTVYWLCTTCFEKRKKRILQPEITRMGRVLRCSECKLRTSC